MSINGNEIVIHEGNWREHASKPPRGKRFGLKPPSAEAREVMMEGVRNVGDHIAKIPRSEWPERIRDQVAARSRNSDVRNTGKFGARMPSTDQDGYGYCWCHSTTSCALLVRALNNQPYADLSAFAIGCIIKGYRNQGGWNGESMKFLRERGVPTSEFWAQQSTNRANDNPKTWENAARHKMTEWEEIEQGDFDMQATCSLLNIPYALDLNWWSHSVCGCDLVDGTQAWNDRLLRDDSGKVMTIKMFERNWKVHDFGAAFGTRIWNSWADSWSDAGMGILTESKARNNGAIACITLRAAA